jgi:DNA mismatch repair ATPase MutL
LHFIDQKLIYKNLAKEIKEAASANEIIIEEKIHITEIEEVIEEEIPTVQKLSVAKDNNGKNYLNLLKTFKDLFTRHQK